MPELELIVATRNYSSWSMRAGVILRESGLAYRETLLPFSPDGKVVGIGDRSPTGQVPVLLVDGVCVWDSAAICETVAELAPGGALWPTDAVARRVARSAAAEMHAGFRALRTNFPMNLRVHGVLRPRTAEADRDIARLVALWTDCRTRFGGDGDFLFGAGFTCADAMFAPVATRFATYAVTLPAVAQRYCDALLARPSVRAWYAAAAEDPTVLTRFEPPPPDGARLP
jgi:glutathione S-transferase